MANAGALINESLWRDRDFRRVPRLPQCTYQQLLAQKDLDCAGVLTLNLRLLAKGCEEVTIDQLREDFTALEEARFVFVDYETDELLVRSYMRLVSVRSPNAWKSAMKAARLVESEKLKAVLAAELRRIPRKDAADLANELDPEGNPSGTHPEPIRNPSEGDNPSGTHSEPPRSVSVVGHLSLVGGQVGEAPPPERCPKHERIDNPPNCRACGKAREANEAWHDQRRADDAARRRQAIESCSRCDEFGLFETRLGMVRCDHAQEPAHA